MNEEIVAETVDKLYKGYGSGTGVLLGIPSNLRISVAAIVRLVLRAREEKVKEAIEESIAEFALEDLKPMVNISWLQIEAKIKKRMGIE